MIPTGASDGPAGLGLEELAASVRSLAGALTHPEPVPGDVTAEDELAREALAVLSRARLIEELVGPGGARVSARRVCVIREELAAISGLADVMFVMQGLGSRGIALAGSEDLKRRYLPGVARGELVAGFALTEPEAGSDVSAIATRATRDGDGYRLDGAKTFISNAGLADVYTLFARTGDGPGREGVTAFAVEAGAPGLTVSERLTVSAPHPIGTLRLDGCRVQAASRLGEEGAGFDLALSVLDFFRPTVGAAALGLARRALDEAVARCRTRTQFGRPLSEFQAVRFKLADMALHLEASRLLVTRAASMIDRPGSAPLNEMRRASSMAKLYATEAAQRIVDEAVQLHGGLGVTRGQVVERLYREVRALRIYEGTSEIQRLVIAASLIREGA